MNEKLKLAMRRLGYRLMGKDVWAKPVAYHLFTIRMHAGKAEWTNHFKGANGKLLVWDRHIIKDTPKSGGYEQAIKSAEYSTHTDMYTGAESDFGFITQEEMFAEVL